MSGEQYRKNNAWGDWQEDTQDTAKILTVDIFEVDTSHVNPRQTRGENYESTKDSIRNIGLQSILTITKVPGADRYSLYNGGNTRLTILKELYDEFVSAGDTQKADTLRYQTCRYVPWTDDLDSLVKQMAENEERSPMTFIDKARAVFRIKELYKNQFKVDEVSDGKLVRYIHSLGWTKVNRQSVIDLAFAFNELETIIPLNLNSGMGKPKVQQLRQWLGDVEMWLEWLGKEHEVLFSPADGRQLYFQVLAEHDCDGNLNLDEFFDTFLLRLGDILVTYDTHWTTPVIRFELQQVRELGYVPETGDMAELTAQLDATSTLPLPVLPKPRKPREPRANGSDETDSSADEPGHMQAARSVYVHNEADDTGSASATPPVSGHAQAHTPYTAPRSRNPNLLMRHPDFELPDRSLPAERYAEITRRLSQDKLRDLISSIDNRGVLTDLVHFEGDKNPFAEVPPYFFIDLEETWQYEIVRDWLRETPRSGVYGALYIISLLYFYSKEIYQFTGDTPDPLSTKAHLKMLWEEFGWIYEHMHLYFHTGIMLNQKAKDGFAILLVARIIHEHSGLLYGVETFGSPQLLSTDDARQASATVDGEPQ